MTNFDNVLGSMIPGGPPSRSTVSIILDRRTGLSLECGGAWSAFSQSRALV